MLRCCEFMSFPKYSKFLSVHVFHICPAYLYEKRGTSRQIKRVFRNLSDMRGICPIHFNAFFKNYFEHISFIPTFAMSNKTTKENKEKNKNILFTF